MRLYNINIRIMPMAPNGIDRLVYNNTQVSIKVDFKFHKKTLLI